MIARGLLVCCAGLIAASAAMGQGSNLVVRGVDRPARPAPEIERAHAAHQKRRAELERELRRIRAMYFRGIRNVEIRQAGIHRLREYTDPAIFPSLLEVFRRDGEDVRTAIMDHLAELKTDEADATLAWTAVFDADETIRAEATRRVVRRVEEKGHACFGVQSVIAEGLRRRDRQRVLASAAHLADVMNLYEAIPMMINAQISPQARRSGADGGGALAYILVGRQTAFVSDLTPVVGDSAVAFDPQLSVVTEGVVLRVLDAVVVTYHVDVHNSLVNMTSRLSGQPTRRLGWDNRKWHEWYTEEFLPAVRAGRIAVDDRADGREGGGEGGGG